MSAAFCASSSEIFAQVPYLYDVIKPRFSCKETLSILSLIALIHLLQRIQRLCSIISLGLRHRYHVSELIDNGNHHSKRYQAPEFAVSDFSHAGRNGFLYKQKFDYLFAQVFQFCCIALIFIPSVTGVAGSHHPAVYLHHLTRQEPWELPSTWHNVGINAVGRCQMRHLQRYLYHR